MTQIGATGKYMPANHHQPTWHHITWFFFIIVLMLISFSALAQEYDSHKVKRGDNLTKLAARYETTISEIKAINNIRGERIMVGQVLRIPKQNSRFHTVKYGDNLTEIANRYDITLDMLRSMNKLKSNTIQPGQKLQIEPSELDEGVYVVVRNDNLSTIAARFKTSVSHLKLVNDLKKNTIYVGQKLRLKDANLTTHIVEKGDALWEIARAYGMSVTNLKNLNNLTSDRIYPGQHLRLPGNGSTKLASYIVRSGDNLTEIARLHQMSLRELRNLNNVSGSIIHPGQKLKVRPLLGSLDLQQTKTPQTPLEVDWAALKISVSGIGKLKAPNGPYYYEKPRATQQKSLTYCEESTINPLISYRHARKLFESFERKVNGMPKLSNRLQGWHFVLDPGHGGIDPGCIVEARDAQGKTYFIVEDEIVYDIALRVFVLLKLHGANVTLTLLSPNHLLRDTDPVANTFVHDRNEVFNSHSWNKKNRPYTWPKGGQKYLSARVDIAKNAFKSTPKNRQIFLSFHADNDPPSGNVVKLIHYQSSKNTDTQSRDFAKKLLPAMGAGALIKGRALGVLRNNPARYKLLVEMRNLAFADHIWAMRYEQLRQRDAEKVVKALLDGLNP